MEGEYTKDRRQGGCEGLEKNPNWLTWYMNSPFQRSRDPVDWESIRNLDILSLARICGPATRSKKFMVDNTSPDSNSGSTIIFKSFFLIDLALPCEEMHFIKFFINPGLTSHDTNWNVERT